MDKYIGPSGEYLNRDEIQVLNKYKKRFEEELAECNDESQKEKYEFAIEKIKENIALLSF